MEVRGPRRPFPCGTLIRATSGGYHFELAGELYFPTAQLQPHHVKLGSSFPFVKIDDAPKLYLRSPAWRMADFLRKSTPAMYRPDLRSRPAQG